MPEKMKKKVKCLCCGSLVECEHEPGASVGEISRSSGYEPIMMRDTTVGWICPSCLDVVVPHVRALVNFFDEPLVFWDSLPHLLNRKKTAAEE
jgi:hypothetical protein